MKSETLQLPGALDEAAAMNVARVLDAVQGVSKITISTANASVTVDFDEAVTSSQALRAALQQAGIGIKKPAHGEAGMCCGSCG
ncbi:MAG TPA: cation transporter [Noviherbaspirillum sp.]|nr:cation transporter [Noviherbaspirillum sp.]